MCYIMKLLVWHVLVIYYIIIKFIKIISNLTCCSFFPVTSEFSFLLWYTCCYVPHCRELSCSEICVDEVRTSIRYMAAVLLKRIQKVILYLLEVTGWSLIWLMFDYKQFILCCFRLNGIKSSLTHKTFITY